MLLAQSRASRFGADGAGAIVVVGPCRRFADVVGTDD